MSRHIYSTYYEDNYLKYGCYICKKSFIVGEELSQGCTLRCPYCGDIKVYLQAKTDDETMRKLDMGSISICFNKMSLLVKQISDKYQGIYSQEEIKASIEAITNVANTFQSLMKELREKFKPIAEELQKQMDKSNNTSTLVSKKMKYPTYKTSLHTKNYLKKKVYYNCRNNC